MKGYTSAWYHDYQTRHQLSHAQQRQRSEAVVGCDEGKAQSADGVLVRFTLYRCKLLDVDAKYASIKDLLDCLHQAGIVAGDREGQLQLEVEQQKVSRRAQERTELEVTLP